MDNAHPGCPAKMSDGRFITDYNPRCLQEMTVVDDNNRPLSSYGYRQYLVQNGEALIKQRMQGMVNTYGCLPCDANTELAPQRYQSCDSRTCAFSPADYTGLGIQRQ